MAGLAGVLGIPKVKPTTGITAEVAPPAPAPTSISGLLGAAPPPSGGMNMTGLRGLTQPPPPSAPSAPSGPKVPADFSNLGNLNITPPPLHRFPATPGGGRSFLGDVAETGLGGPGPMAARNQAIADASAAIHGVGSKFANPTPGGPGISPIVPVQGLEATVAPSNSWGSALAPVVRSQAPGVDIDPIGALRSRQFSDGFNFPGF